MAECNLLDKVSQQHMALMVQWECHHHHSTALHQVWEAIRWECQNQWVANRQDLQKPIQTLYLTEGN